MESILFSDFYINPEEHITKYLVNEMNKCISKLLSFYLSIYLARRGLNYCVNTVSSIAEVAQSMATLGWPIVPLNTVYLTTSLYIQKILTLTLKKRQQAKDELKTKQIRRQQNTPVVKKYSRICLFKKSYLNFLSCVN